MFTGLIEVMGRVTKTNPFSIDFPENGLTIREGDSISVNGVCLTALRPTSTSCQFDVSAETARVTTLAQLEVGSPINLEAAMQAGSRLGGHIVQGHVDARGEVANIESGDGFHRLVIRCPDSLSPYLVPKGSITVDGVSLTVNSVFGSSIDLMIIPHTFEKTVIKFYTAGQNVNLEVDILGKYIVKYLENYENNARLRTR